MPSRPRSRESSRSSERISFKYMSILENGGQAPWQDETNAAVQDKIELVSPNSQSIPDGFPCPFPPATTATSEAVPPISAIIDAVQSDNERASTGTRIDLNASGQRDTIPHKRFGIHTDQLRGQRLQGSLPTDYKQKYPEDPIYKETEENARVFHVYNDESQIFDNDMVIEAGDSLDILLVFAGLFASVLTTFVVQTSQSLSPDKTDISNSLLREMISLQRAQENGTSFTSIPAADTSFTTSRSDIWVNSLWFVSLALSLSTALLAVIAKQWLRQYSSFVSGTARERALIRQFRYDGLEKWRVRLIIGLLPTILHISLFLFLAGLVVFLLPLNNTLACIIASIASIICATYITTNVLPIISIQCPYRTQLSEILNTLYGVVKMIPVMLLLFTLQPWCKFVILMEYLGVIHSKHDWIPRRIAKFLNRRFYRWSTPLKELERVHANEGGKWGLPLGITGALEWLAQTTSDISARAIIAEAVGSIWIPRTLKKTSVEHAVDQQVLTLIPPIRAGELFGAEDESFAERIIRSTFRFPDSFHLFYRHGMTDQPIQCHTHSMMLIAAVCDSPSRLHIEDEESQDLLPAQVFSFIAERDDLLADLEAPIWMWWSLFTRAADATENEHFQFQGRMSYICENGHAPHFDSWGETWLRKVNIPLTLRHAVRKCMTDVYSSDYHGLIVMMDRPYTFVAYSASFRARAHSFKVNPPSPFSTVTLVTFIYDNFAQFTDFWME